MKYTKKQITEAIAHWTKVLEDLDNGQRCQHFPRLCN